MGVAQSQSEASHAAVTVRAIKGVKSLKPHLRVVPKKN
jgi:osmotically-inducible protein OsmY